MLVPAQAGLAVGEYAPNTVKKTVVGVGHAAKTQIDHMVRLQLPGVVIAGPDAADALAIAICHAHHVRRAGSWLARGDGEGAAHDRPDRRAARLSRRRSRADRRARRRLRRATVSDRTLAALPGPGEAVALYTDLLVREDLLQLFGFPTLVEKEWHRLLMIGAGDRREGVDGDPGHAGAPRAWGGRLRWATGRRSRRPRASGRRSRSAWCMELKDKAPAVMAMGGTRRRAVRRGRRTPAT